jgi:hypothetical protein
MSDVATGVGTVGSAASGAATGFMVAGPVGAVVGGVIGGISGLIGGGAKKKAAKAARRVANFKATLLEGNADEVLRTAAINNDRLGQMLTGLQQRVGFNLASIGQDSLFVLDNARKASEKVRRNYNKVRGSQMTAIAASGVTTGGSSADVMRDTELEFEYAFIDEIHKGQVESTRLKNQAELMRFEGDEKVEDFMFRQSETMRQGEINAKNLRSEANLVRMAGNANASSIKASALASSLNSIMNGASAVVGSGMLDKKVYTGTPTPLSTNVTQEPLLGPGF